MDRTTKGVLLGFASFAVFSFSDACVKLIGGQLPPYESAFFGAVFGLTILPFLLRKGDRWIDILSTTGLPPTNVYLLHEATAWFLALERRAHWLLGSADCFKFWVSSSFYRASRS